MPDGSPALTTGSPSFPSVVCYSYTTLCEYKNVLKKLGVPWARNGFALLKSRSLSCFRHLTEISVANTEYNGGDSGFMINVRYINLCHPAS